MRAVANDILIVGAGAYGLATAWWLAERDSGAAIRVVDGGAFASGGTGRNVAGFRMQWGLEFNVRLSQESIAFFEEAGERLDYPAGIDLKQGGYLLLAHTEADLGRLREANAVHKDLGVPSELLSAADCRRIAPIVAPEGLLGGSFCAKDGTASPFLWLDALLTACRRRGVDIDYGTTVRRIVLTSGGFEVETDAGAISAAKILICTDWQTPELLAPLGVELPITGLAKEAMATEPWADVLGPLLVALKRDTVIAQVKRGSFLVYAPMPDRAGQDFDSTPPYLGHAASAFVDLLPSLSHLKALRCWTGVVSQTPDMQAVLGETQVPGLFVAVSAYKGFMTSPAVGRLMAELLLDGHSNHPAAAPLRPGRFATGDLVPEPLTV
ncbi:MAG: FAD-binding oxidoreductase [Alphaproteobacteria bacterium]|nr:FAD-binding oxidoreductase [Alphaproteobacteria bacterium]